MKKILRPDQTSEILGQLSVANKSFDNDYPGKSLRRQPVHTIYGGAHLFKAETAQKMGQLALNNLADFAPNFVVFAKALGLKGAETLSTKSSKNSSLSRLSIPVRCLIVTGILVVFFMASIHLAT